MRGFMHGLTIGAGIVVGAVTTTLIAVTVGGLNTFNSGDLISASQINTNFATLRTAIQSVHEVPVGTITAWHKDFYAAAPALPDGWVECDGQTINDAASPFDGQAVPDLNGQGRFLRGSATSGTNQAESFASHSHTAVYKGTTDRGGSQDPLLGHCAILTTDRTGEPGCAPGGVDWSNRGHISVSAAGGGETRPDNMSVVWIIKIK